MTRYTNLGRKRSYVDAGMKYREDADPQDASTSTAAPADPSTSTPADASDALATTAGASEPPKKKRRRGKASNEKRDAKRGDGEGENAEEAGEGVKEPRTPATSGEALAEDNGEKPESNKAKKLRQYKEKQKAKRKKDDADRAAASEKRRLKRISERHANKVCYACREMGHAAQLCPNVKPEDQTRGGNPAGICYRCGSLKHTLSRCRKAENSKNPMPFASCFVCSGKGHLASGCPQNKSRGIYPNGGSCKLCQETTHLAINCPLRQTDPGLVTAVFGIGREAGADEDDFHTFKRKNVEVDREVQGVEKRMKMAEVRVGKHSGAARVFGPAPAPVKPKKVITF